MLAAPVKSNIPAAFLMSKSSAPTTLSAAMKALTSSVVGLEPQQLYPRRTLHSPEDVGFGNSTSTGASCQPAEKFTTKGSIAMNFRLLAGIALFAALALPAIAANPPVHFSDTQTVSDSFVCPDGTLITSTATFNETGTAFFGLTTHVILHDFIDQTLTGPTGKILSGTNRQNETFNVNTGAFSVRGVSENLRTADGTIVAHAAGRVTVDSSGNVSLTPSLTKTSLANICAALE